MTQADAAGLQAGTYVCVRTASPLGAAVRLFCRSPYDHAFLITGPGEIVQATVRGVKAGPLSQFAGCEAVANAAEPVTGAQRAAIVAHATSMVGDEYGWVTLVVIALRKLGLRWGWLLKASGDRDATICSQLVAAAGQAAGLDWLCGESEPAMVQPAELATRHPWAQAVTWP